MNIAYIWADGEFLLTSLIQEVDPEHGFGYTKSDDYFVYTGKNNPSDVRHLFNSKLEYLEFVELVS